MHYRIRGVSAETGKSVTPIEIEAATETDAGAQAKLAGILPTSIRAVPPIETIEIVAVRTRHEESAAANPETRSRISLITIQGRWWWFAATLGIGFLSAGFWYFDRSEAPRRSEPIIQTADPRLTPQTEPVGLGWSLAEIERQWSAANGWYWHSKEHARVGTGIRYIAGNTEIEWITLQVIGPPENLHTFRVLSQVSLDLWTSDEEAAVKIATACLIASRIIGLEDQEVPDWAGEVLVRWFDRPQPSHVESTIFGAFVVTLSFDVDEIKMNAMLTVEPAVQ